MKRAKAGVGVALLFLPLLVAGTAAAATLDDLELRDLWMGEAWDKESLKDRTVVVEFWALR